MICVNYKCVFVHIPKTAGQSIERFFLDLLGMTWQERDKLLLRPNSDPTLGPERLAHLTAEEYVRFGYLTREEFADHFKFAFVRNPWERLVSEFHFQGRHRCASFKEFVLHGLPKAGLSDAYRHILPQYDYVYNSQGELIVDFVGRFENLQSDFDKICLHLDIKKTRLPHVNVSQSHSSKKNILQRLLCAPPRKKKYTDYYDDETLIRVTEIYEKDIQAFGYKFGQ